MPKITNVQLIDSVQTASEQGRIDWQPTGTPEQFAASFGGKWTLVIDKSTGPGGQEIFYLDLQDSTGQSILRITNWDSERISGLYEMARRHALKVDEALADLLKELDNPQK